MVWFFAVAVTVMGLITISTVYLFSSGKKQLSRQTTGDVEVIHSKVYVAGHEQKGLGRVAPGEHVVTEGTGRARLHLVEGITALLDVSTEVAIDVGKLQLYGGKLFIDSPEGRKITLNAGELTAQLAASKTAIELLPQERRVTLYCAQGEVMVTVKGQSQRVGSGETLRWDNGKFTVEPEKAFDDWTQGLAVPWQTQKLSRSSLPEVWVYNEQGEPEALLNTTNQVVSVTLDGELATTKTVTRYYNGNDHDVKPRLRVALPPKAQLNRVSYQQLPKDTVHEATLALCDTNLSKQPGVASLEWGGNGWLSGRLPTVASGNSIELLLEYSLWQDVESQVMTYRHPFAKGIDAPQIGELRVRVDASNAGSPWLEANRGVTRTGDVLFWHASDVRPSDDWVTRYVPAVIKPKEARAYVEPSSSSEDAYVMVRFESPTRPEKPVRVALVVDISASVGGTGLELGRNLVEALLGNLSEKDSAIVVVADEEQRALLVDRPATLSKEWRKQLQLELSKLRPGGASDIGRALEYAADKLDGAADANQYENAVVYLGDGKPTLGALTSEQLRGRLARRTSGMPKLSAVALGRTADVWQLAKLVASAGEIHAVSERAEAAVVASQLVASLQEPTYGDWRIELGPEIDRVYPRVGQSVSAGSTVTAYGRLRGTLPKTIKVTYFDGGKPKFDEITLKKVSGPSGADVARRWAEQRLFELVGTKDGLKPALMLAKEHRLLTPWSTWVFEEPNSNGRFTCTSYESRIVELSTLNDTPYAARIAPERPVGSGWLEPPTRYDEQQSLENAVTLNTKATILRSLPAVNNCFNVRFGVTSALPSKVDYSLRILQSGAAEQVRVTASNGEPTDPPFLRCVERVIAKGAYLGGEQAVSVIGTLELLEVPRVKRSICSVASRLPLELRKSVWVSRVGSPINIYMNALNSCELPTWTDRRKVLEGLIDREKSIEYRINFGKALRAHGFTDAATHVEHSTLDRLGNLEELESARRLMLSDEPNVDALLVARLKKANTDDARLQTVREALRLAPHSPLGRRLLLLLLEELHRIPELLRTADEIRQDPFADAGLITSAAAALRRLGEERSSRRAFAELFERAPFDPWVLAFAGDHLRHAGLYDEAVLAYESLSAQQPNDTSNFLRLGLAQANAGRVDIASRLLERASQVGGRGDDERLNALSAYVKAVILAEARDQAKLPKERDELTRRLAETALPETFGIVLIELGERLEEPVEVTVYRGRQGPAESPELSVAPLGLYGLALEPGVPELRVVLQRRLITKLGRSLKVKLHLLRLGSNLLDRTLVTHKFAFEKNAETTEVMLPTENRP
jgi:tetratricopeptide (TPR) repeat protein